jgi:hypothetical protein
VGERDRVSGADRPCPTDPAPVGCTRSAGRVERLEEADQSRPEGPPSEADVRCRELRGRPDPHARRRRTARVRRRPHRVGAVRLGPGDHGRAEPDLRHEARCARELAAPRDLDRDCDHDRLLLHRRHPRAHAGQPRGRHARGPARPRTLAPRPRVARRRSERAREVCSGGAAVRAVGLGRQRFRRAVVGRDVGDLPALRHLGRIVPFALGNVRDGAGSHDLRQPVRDRLPRGRGG